jgi:hypothetical protein
MSPNQEQENHLVPDPKMEDNERRRRKRLSVAGHGQFVLPERAQS